MSEFCAIVSFDDDLGAAGLGRGPPLLEGESFESPRSVSRCRSIGFVYKAHSVKLQGPVAVKILKEVHNRKREIVSRFEREVKAAATNRGQHVVQVLDTGRSTEPPFQDCLYLVTEYLEEGDLLDWLRDHPPNDRESLRAAVEKLVEVCSSTRP